MIAALGFASIIILLILLMTKKASPVVALIIIPIIAGLIGGFGLEIIPFITEGLKEISTTGVMFIFAILFFGVLTDAGTFKPLIKRLLRMAGNDPAKIALATAILAMMVHLDGSGAVTFLVVIPAMLPVYEILKMRRTTLAMIVALAAGTMNIMPWGGPTIRAATALTVPVTELFNPLLIPIGCGLAAVLGISFWIGKKEKRLVAANILEKDRVEYKDANGDDYSPIERPKLLWLNYVLIIISITVLIAGIVPPHIIFMVAFALAITLNYPNLQDQGKRIDAHAKAAILMASILFAAGCFIGILKGSGMITAMSEVAVNTIPQSVGSHLPVIVGVLSMPASLLFDPDSFYFGILPVLATTAEQFNVASIEVGRAAILGQMTTGFPVSPLTGSTYLLIGLTGVDLGEHQKRTIPYAFLITLIMLIVSILVGAIAF
jgi:CitMHS family citrate-Mg2+:H+ or citrate-Ca2+:H+ symporter